jgi:hypothetical protein
MLLRVARIISPLQRISSALAARGGRRLRTTDWWAVFIEIMVVVLGILIAFEMQEWGNTRERHRNERALLQRIEEEARGDYLAVHRIWQQHRESADNYRLLAEAITDRNARAEYQRRGGAGCNLLRLPAVRYASAGSGALGAGDRLELISDRTLRDRLRQADAERIFAESQLANFRDVFDRYAPLIEPHMRWAFMPGGVACEVDIAGLSLDLEAVALLPKLHRDQRQFARYRAREGQAAFAVLDRVRCLRNGQCGPK